MISFYSAYCKSGNDQEGIFGQLYGYLFGYDDKIFYANISPEEMENFRKEPSIKKDFEIIDPSLEVIMNNLFMPNRYLMVELSGGKEAEQYTKLIVGHPLMEKIVLK